MRRLIARSFARTGASSSSRVAGARTRTGARACTRVGVDFELTGMYDVLPDSKAPQGLYGFDDAIDIDAWQKLGAEAIVKVAAQKKSDTQIQVLGIAYFLNVGKEPVYQKTIVVNKSDARITGHRITDALLGALTGRNGSFASELTFSGKWAQNRGIFRMDADGNSLLAFTD